MAIRLTSEQILEKVQRAFAPFHVVAELQDYHRKVGFRVYADNDEIVWHVRRRPYGRPAKSRKLETAHHGYANTHSSDE